MSDAAITAPVTQPANGRAPGRLSVCATCGSRQPGCRCIHDIREPDAFVQATLNASGRIYPAEEREELLAEGLAILCRLARDFEPHRNGYAQEGRFSGFAAKYLRLKLEDAYHRLHPEHMLRTQVQCPLCQEFSVRDTWPKAEGRPGWLDCPECEEPTAEVELVDERRRYTYGERAVSLEAVVQQDPDRHALLAGKPDETDLRARVGRALDERWARRREMILDVAETLGSGATWSDAAAMLGLPPQMVRDAVAEIQLVADRLESEER